MLFSTLSTIKTINANGNIHNHTSVVVNRYEDTFKCLLMSLLTITPLKPSGYEYLYSEMNAWYHCVIYVQSHISHMSHLITYKYLKLLVIHCVITSMLHCVFKFKWSVSTSVMNALKWGVNTDIHKHLTMPINLFTATL